VRITAAEGDITHQDVDAVVNAANSSMRGGGGVDGAIHRVGGPQILAECVEKFPDGLPTGSAGWTTGGRLPARYVIHVVGPNYRAGQRDPDLLASCYREAVRIADDLGARTLAMPAVSAGIYGWPLKDAARIAVETVGASEADVTLEEARFVLFGANVYAVFANEVSKWSRERDR
jgi:O-acetyl-ADP-ribose deacetylase (regulator of RNase III)